MSECHRTNSLLKGIMIVWKTKVRKFVAFLTWVLGRLKVNRAAEKTCWLTNLSKNINKFKKKGPQIRCIPHGRWGLTQCKSTCEENAGSDISLENITLWIQVIPLWLLWWQILIVNTRDQVTSDRRSKRAWWNCVLCIPFILSRSPNEYWLHTCDSCVVTAWRLGLRAPLVARNKQYWNKTRGNKKFGGIYVDSNLTYAIYVLISFLKDLVIASVLPIISACPSFVLKGTKNLFSFHQFKSRTVFH